MLRVAQLRAGLSTLLGQQLVLMGTFFVIPVYLQVVLGLDAFETGKRLLPLSVAMLVFALLGPRIAARRSPRTVAQLGLVAVSIGAIVMLATLDVELNDTGFKIALALIGAGAGLLASQLGNVIMSSVPPEKTSEGGGLQGTAQNLGSSLGTAIIGAVLLASLATGFSERSPTTRISRRTRGRRSSPTPRTGSTSCRSARSSRRPWRGGSAGPGAAWPATTACPTRGARLALGAVALRRVLSLWFTRRLPTRSSPTARANPRRRRPRPRQRPDQLDFTEDEPRGGRDRGQDRRGQLMGEGLNPANLGADQDELRRREARGRPERGQQDGQAQLVQAELAARGREVAGQHATDGAGRPRPTERVDDHRLAATLEVAERAEARDPGVEQLHPAGERAELPQARKTWMPKPSSPCQAFPKQTTWSRAGSPLIRP